jgi:hypothetical protein
LREKIKELEKCLREYQHFDGTDYDISKVLELSTQFFSKQWKIDDSFKQIPDVKLFSPYQ